MNIYRVDWSQDGCCALSAVVIAEDASVALSSLDLTEEDTGKRVVGIGIEPLGEESATAWVVVQETL